MRISKKILAIALSILMAVSMMPFTVFADSASFTKVTNASQITAENIGTCTSEDAKAWALANWDVVHDNDNFSRIVWINTGDLYYASVESYMSESYFSAAFDNFVYYGVQISDIQQLFGYGDNVYLCTPAAPAAPVKPTATVTEIPYAVVQQFFPDAPAMDVVYQFVANNDGDDVYRTYNADFVVSFDKAVPQGAVKLYGQYGQYPITECPITKDLAAGEEYRLLKDSMGLDMTYQQILDEVQTFFCGAKFTAAAAGATMTIKLAIYETAVNPSTGLPEETGTEVEIDDAEQEKTAAELPQATVTDVTNTAENTEGFDKCIKFVAPQEASAYDDEYCDFIVNFDQDVTSDDIELWGKYGNYAWTNLTSEASGGSVTFEAGKDYYLLKDIVKWPMTYKQIRENVGTFLCGLNCHVGAAGVTTNVELSLFPEPAEGEEPVPAQIGETQDYTAPALPQATVTDITNDPLNELGLDAAYKFEAPAGTTAYDDEYCDFVVRFDQDVTSDDIELWGKYGQFDWTTLASEASGGAYTFEAGKDYYLLKDVVKFPMTYAQIRQIGTFMCGVNSNYGANGVTMDVELVLYEEPAQGEEPTAVVLDDEEFVAPDKPDPATQDEISITTADEIDVNLYLAETGEEATVEYTYNTTPDIQEDTQRTKTVDFNSLPEIAGKRKLTIRVAPAQIRDNIDIVIKDAQGGEIRSYENYSVAEYCDQLAEGNYSTNIKNLAKSVLDYGKAAANFFGYNESAFANQADNFNSFTFDTTGFTAIASGIDVQKVRYVATSVPSLRFEVDMTEAEAERYTVVTDKGYAAKFVKVEDKVILQVTGIPAAKLGETITVSVKDAQEDVIATIQYTPLAYAYMASKANNAELSRLGETIGQYATAANAVFA